MGLAAPEPSGSGTIGMVAGGQVGGAHGVRHPRAGRACGEEGDTKPGRG